MPADMVGLRKPFPPELIGKLPSTGRRPALDYVGHAAVTDRLLQCAPGWEFKVLERFTSGDACWVYAALTIDNVTREEYGEGPDPKKAISDALKRCAMRFGVALDLWSKEDLDSGSPSVGTSTPDDGNRGEGPTDGVAESGGGAEANGLDDALPSDAIKEPHDHVRGRQLASGKYLCAFELPDGSVCGEKTE